MGENQKIRDYADLADLVIAILNDPAPRRPWQAVLEALMRLFDGCGAVYCDVSRPSATAAVHSAVVRAIAPSGLREQPLENLLGQAAGSDPLIQHYLTTADLSPHATGDVMDVRTWRRTPGYAMANELMGASSCVSLPLAGGANTHRGVTITLPTGVPAEPGHLNLHRVQSLLIALHRYLMHLSRWQRMVAPRHEEHGTAPPSAELGLTSRELTVLALLGEAHTATATGHRLGISPRTVQKHLENLYRKMDTTDRVSTILRAQTIGLLPHPSSRR